MYLDIGIEIDINIDVDIDMDIDIDIVTNSDIEPGQNESQSFPKRDPGSFGSHFNENIANRPIQETRQTPPRLVKAFQKRPQIIPKSSKNLSKIAWKIYINFDGFSTIALLDPTGEINMFRESDKAR